VLLLLQLSELSGPTRRVPTLALFFNVSTII
jgi:hypothetical protein